MATKLKARLGRPPAMCCPSARRGSVIQLGCHRLNLLLCSSCTNQKNANTNHGPPEPEMTAEAFQICTPSLSFQIPKKLGEPIHLFYRCIFSSGQRNDELWSRRANIAETTGLHMFALAKCKLLLSDYLMVTGHNATTIIFWWGRRGQDPRRRCSTYSFGCPRGQSSHRQRRPFRT